MGPENFDSTSREQFGFRFRLFIQFLPLWSMDDKVEAELKMLSPSTIFINWKLNGVNISLVARGQF